MRIEKRGEDEWLIGAPDACDGCDEFAEDGGQCCHHLSGEHLAVAWPGNDGASLIFARWPIEASANVAGQSVVPMLPPGTVHGPIESADAFFAAPASTPRPAEEIAREMVPEPRHLQSRGWISTVCGYEIGMAPSSADQIRSDIARAIEQARADGVAAAVAGQQPRDPAPRLRCACDHRDDNACSLREDYFGASEGCACDCHRPDAPQPRDLAGRIRALLMRKAGEWATETRVGVSDELHDVMNMLRLVIHRNSSVAAAEACVDEMRKRARTFRFFPAGETLKAAADQLEAIVRECEAEQ
jgi:hypothetical protein